MTSSILFDYIASGLAADRPADPNTASVSGSGAIYAGAIMFWLSTDTGTLSAWDTDNATWVDLVGGISDLSTFDTGDLAEGGNLYYTAARFNTAFTAKSTSDLAEGANLYFTDARAVSAVAAPVVPPQGRLTLTTAVPVLVSDVLAAATIYYTPYAGAHCPIYDGTKFVMTEFAELSQATTDAGKSPAACANNSNYDLFVWNDAGTVRCTRGPLWTSDTARGTGAGTTELERVKGILLNKVAITNGPAANRGTYVGTIRTNGSAVVDLILGGAGAAGGEQSICGIWNAYNRRPLKLNNYDNTDSWNYTTATLRAKNGNSNNNISFIRGLNEDAVDAVNDMFSLNATANITRVVGIGLDSTTALAADSSSGTSAQSSNAWGYHAARYLGLPGLGFHYLSPLEESQASGASTFYGDAGAPTFQKNMFRALVWA